MSSAMERAPNSSKGAILLRYLQKVATFTIANHPHSPHGGAADRRPAARGFSGAIPPMIPAESQHKKRNDGAFCEEPTSPKVTCIGQIKHKKKKTPSGELSQRVKEKKSKQDTGEATGVNTAFPAPALGNLRKFASGRETLSGFDWESNIYHSAPLFPSGGGGGGGGSPAAENTNVDLWRRRAMTPPLTLNVNK